jgi:hypothetical protein
MRVYNLPLIMARCLILTVLCETIFAIIIGVRKKRDIVNIILVNIMTNPPLVSITFACNIFYGIQARNILLTILEIAVVFIEGFVYYKYLDFKKINPFILALLLNAVSYGMGELYNYIFY